MKLLIEIIIEGDEELTKTISILKNSLVIKSQVFDNEKQMYDYYFQKLQCSGSIRIKIIEIVDMIMMLEAEAADNDKMKVIL